MLPRSEKKRADYYPLRAALDASRISGRDGRLGDFHVGWFNDIEFLSEALAKKTGQLFEHAIAFITS